jgi:hypothetical protein
MEQLDLGDLSYSKNLSGEISFKGGRSVTPTIA